MKIRLIMLLCACSNVYAESWPLPPVVDNSTYPATPGNTAKPSSATNVYELLGRLEQLQSEVQQLTGKVEEQAYLIAEMKKHQSTMYSDFDERMQSLEKKTEGVASSAAETTEKQGPSVESSVAASSADKQVVEQKKEVVQASGEASAPTHAPHPLPVGDEKQQYQQAYDALRNGHTSQAIAEFNALLSQNPGGEYANNAQYWLGEAYRVNQDIDSARKAFNSVIENYPDSSKVPDALLKLGYIEVDQKNMVKAREYLTRVTLDFPSSTAAQLASKKLHTLEDVKN
jgi:tol-pal system protein YbgF